MRRRSALSDSTTAGSGFTRIAESTSSDARGGVKSPTGAGAKSDGSESFGAGILAQAFDRDFDLLNEGFPIKTGNIDHLLAVAFANPLQIEA